MLLDADRELAQTAVAEFNSARERDPQGGANGGLRARRSTSDACYSELNRKLVKELRFDGQRSGGAIAMPHAALAVADLPETEAGVAPHSGRPVGIAVTHRVRAAFARRVP